MEHAAHMEDARMFDSAGPGALACRCVASLLSLLTASCATTPSVPPSAEPKTAALASTSWTAVLIDSRFAEGLRPTLVVLDDGSARADTGCNVYLAATRGAEGKIQILDLQRMVAVQGPGRKPCEPRFTDQEGRFLAALKAVRTFRAQQGKLMLLDATNTARLLFERMEMGGRPGSTPKVLATPFVPGQPSSFGEYASRSGATLPAPSSDSTAPFAYDANDPLAGLELVAITPGVGRYFGTDRGVLVTRVLALNDLSLQEGDVILSINGREPVNGPHALKILSSYPAGETLALQVLRQREMLSLEVTLHN
jgi:heat shock protein HslJ